MFILSVRKIQLGAQPSSFSMGGAVLLSAALPCPTMRRTTVFHSGELWTAVRWSRTEPWLKAMTSPQ